MIKDCKMVVGQSPDNGNLQGTGPNDIYTHPLLVETLCECRKPNPITRIIPPTAQARPGLAATLALGLTGWWKRNVSAASRRKYYAKRRTSSIGPERSIYLVAK